MLGRNKYKATRTFCRQFGHKCNKKHDSKAEAARCDVLFLVEKNGKLTYDSQARYDFVVNGVLVGYHVVDFRINTGLETYVEDVKGAKTREWVMKYKLFVALFPNIRYVVNFSGTFQKGVVPKIKRVL